MTNENNKGDGILYLKKIVIQNFKSYRDFSMCFNDDINIIVGDNEAGKSTLLESINLVLSGQINGRNILYELSPYLFNGDTVREYIQKIKIGENVEPPQILIEMYLEDTDETKHLKGTNNKNKENAPGIYMSIEYDDNFTEEYQAYLDGYTDVRTIPIEYYTVKWFSFAHNSVTSRGIPIDVTLIDTTITKMQNGTDKYISKIINDTLEVKERVELALNFRKLKESFSTIDAIQSINSKLTTKRGDISDKELTVSVDISQRNNWESTLISYLNEIPFDFIGKGEQNTVKMKLALETNAKESHVVLIEEPENHLSFSNMSRLIKDISNRSQGKQLIITTHSNFVMNKLGVEKVILLNNSRETMTLKDLSGDTKDYFMKLPGYDTLRMLLSRKTILVEGPSDELIVQKAYVQEYGKLPIEDGVDVISVDSLAFKRFLEIAKKLKNIVSMVTDNDGSVDQIKKKYKDYFNIDNIKICFDIDEGYPTLEPQIVKNNGLKTMNAILNVKYTSEVDLMKYMQSNKTSCALKIFESEKEITIPGYIKDAIK
ncbi:ATP-dependent endonuclease [Bacillus cereus]|uniref:ATP-dependent nuclease n=1 Tax=Bacillus cereus TaxID=1396 RepID=UPI0011A459A6|nr:AAA family ATPase [Bacillus cereus]